MVFVILTHSCEKDDNNGNNDLTVADIEGNVYNTVTIGTQVWMAENLKTTKYNDGTEIPLVTDNKEWDDLTTPGYCWYENDQVTYGNTCGAIYNWYTVNTGNLCPSGWHVPTDAEWTTLENYLIANGYNYIDTASGNFIAKSLAASKNWNSSTRTGCVGNPDYPEKRNATGFTALPTGYREYDGTFYAFGNIGVWWSSEEYGQDLAWERSIGYDFSNVFRIGSFKDNGASVRCLKD
jgi:uncharacterized protein (TIGR02145 family)